MKKYVQKMPKDVVDFNPGDNLKCTVLYTLFIGNIMREYDALDELDATIRFFEKYVMMHQEEI